MSSRRGGFTLVEMVMAMTLTMLIFSAAIPFFRAQVRALGIDAARMEARQAGRFSSDMIDRELHAAGLGITEQQPALVAVGPRSITFNANLVTGDTADMNAAYYDPSVGVAFSSILPKDRAIALPLVGGTYPAVSYKVKDGNDAETISYWAAPDSNDPRPNQYVLWRRVNDGVPSVVVRNVILGSGEALFRYFKTDSANGLVEVSGAALPLIHTEPLHGTPADTARPALLDSIRVIRFSLAIRQATTTVGTDSIQRLERMTILGNAAQAVGGGSCGGAPAPTTLTAAPGPGVAVVTLSWSPSLDENFGEKDVERYLIYRRLVGTAAFGPPLASIPAGLSSYTFTDRDVTTGQSWTYGVLAQDCAGSNSGLSISNVVVP